MQTLNTIRKGIVKGFGDLASDLRLQAQRYLDRIELSKTNPENFPLERDESSLEVLAGKLVHLSTAIASSQQVYSNLMGDGTYLHEDFDLPSRYSEGGDLHQPREENEDEDSSETEDVEDSTDSSQVDS